MKNTLFDRRRFMTQTAKAATGMALLSSLPKQVVAEPRVEPRIKFSVININHNHIYGMTDAVTRGGGQLVSFYAKEPDLVAAFAKRYPNAKLASSQKEILEDKSIQLILSSGIPIERAPLGLEVMKHGKDYLVDKPGITSLEQLADVRRVQKETKQIYSIMYSERHENRATVKAGELVKDAASDDDNGIELVFQGFNLFQLLKHLAFNKLPLHGRRKQLNMKPICVNIFQNMILKIRPPCCRFA